MFTGNMPSLQAQCSNFGTVINNTNDPLITNSSGTDNCPTCASFCGFVPGNLRIGTGNPSTGFIEITTLASTQIIQINVSALSNSTGAAQEYISISIDGVMIDLNDANVSITPIAGGLGSAYVTTTANNYSGIVGVLESTGAAGCATIEIDLGCNVMTNSVIRVDNIQSFGTTSAAGSYVSVGLCSDAPTSSGTCENNECTGAAMLTEGIITADNSSGATQSLPACTTTGNFTGTADDDVWYTFTASSTGKATITVESTGANPIGDLVFELFSGSCGSLTSLGCEDGEFTADPESNAFDVVMGDQYFVRVYSFDANSPGTFNIDYRIDPQPSNDFCANAIAITPTNNSINGTTNGATQTIGACATNSDSEDDVWYTFTSLADENASITVEPSGTDPIDDIVFEIFTGDCNNLNSIACINQSTGTETTSQAVTANTQYFIRVYDFNNDGKTRGEFTITIDGTILPVELLSFQAKAVDNQHIQLFWQTASETNNEGFEIQRSTNGKDFKKLAFVKGNGTTLAQQSYQLIDEDVQADQLYYYRLKQLDFDGSFEYSSIQAVQFKTDKTTLSIVPNPVSKGMAQLTYTTPAAQPLEVFIFDANGQLLQQMRHQVRSGENTLSLDLTVLDSGIYFVKVVQQDQSLFERMVVQ